MFLEHHSEMKRFVVVSSFQNKKSSLKGQNNGRQECLCNVVTISIFFQKQVRFALTGGDSKKQKYPTFNLVYKIAYAQH